VEFFKIAAVAAEAGDLQQRLRIATLAEYCASIDRVLEDRGESGDIYCIWGQFEVRREAVNGGVRFSLPHCPNLLAWTVTTGHPPAPEQVVIHCTIARSEHDPEFLETIEMFAEDWRLGIERALAEQSPA
jgi:hypothetical protein